MADGLSEMMGRHDFRNLCKMNCEQVYNFERVMVKGKVVSPQTVYSVSEGSIVIEDQQDSIPCSSRDMCHVEICGQAFLWHQIRCIMSILFLVGCQLEPPEVVKELLDIQTNPAKPSYEMASENALVLQDCSFANLTYRRSVKNLWDVTNVLKARWEKHALGAVRARDLIATIKDETHVRWSDLVAFVEQIAKEKRRKEQKLDMKLNSEGEEEIQQLLQQHAPSSEMMSWQSAVNVIQNVLGVYPNLPNGCNEGAKGLTDSSVHTPLMGRSKGTTYEEKVQSILELIQTMIMMSARVLRGVRGTRRTLSRRERLMKKIRHSMIICLSKGDLVLDAYQNSNINIYCIYGLFLALLNAGALQYHLIQLYFMISIDSLEVQYLKQTLL